MADSIGDFPPDFKTWAAAVGAVLTWRNCPCAKCQVRRVAANHAEQAVRAPAAFNGFELLGDPHPPGFVGSSKNAAQAVPEFNGTTQNPDQDSGNIQSSGRNLGEALSSVLSHIARIDALAQVLYDADDKLVCKCGEMIQSSVQKILGDLESVGTDISKI